MVAEVSGSFEYEHKISLTEVLEELTRKELISLCKRHGMHRYSDLNKSGLIEAISRYILTKKVLYNYFVCMNDSEIEYVRMARDYDGIVDEAEPEALSYMIIGGYAGFTKNLKFGIPWEVLECFDALDTEDFERQRKRICLIGNYSHIANYLYGVTPPMQIVKMFNQHEKKKTDWEEVIHTYKVIEKYRSDFVYVDGYFVDTIFKKNYEELLKLQGNIPYYTPSQAEVEEWCQIGFPTSTGYIIELYRYMTQQLWIDQDMAADVCFMLDNTIHIGCTLKSVRDELERCGVRCRTKRQHREFEVLLKNLIDHSRMIIYRGFTPAEAARLQPDREV